MRDNLLQMMELLSAVSVSVCLLILSCFHSFQYNTRNIFRVYEYRAYFCEVGNVYSSTSPQRNVSTRKLTYSAGRNADRNAHRQTDRQNYLRLQENCQGHCHSLLASFNKPIARTHTCTHALHTHSHCFLLNLHTYSHPHYSFCSVHAHSHTRTLYSV